MTRLEYASHKESLMATIREIEKAEGSSVRSVGFYAKAIGTNRKEASELIQMLAYEKRITIKTQWVDGVKRMRISTKESI